MRFKSPWEPFLVTWIHGVLPWCVMLVRHACSILCPTHFCKWIIRYVNSHISNLYINMQSSSEYWEGLKKKSWSRCSCYCSSLVWEAEDKLCIYVSTGLYSTYDLVDFTHHCIYHRLGNFWHLVIRLTRGIIALIIQCVIIISALKQQKLNDVEI